ncbi:MAG TPA: SEC-C domain-containing protein [Verrucomicrobiae bacterium]|nr:SEC-C domain-containing protein [Verrucomicrobiae bacterium]
MKTGRNDPCHCGSGKKYKLCHLPLEEAAQRAAIAEKVKPAAPARSAGEELDQAVRTLEGLKGTGDVNHQAEIARLLARTAPLLAYLNREPEIRAAETALEAHHQELFDLAKDNTAYQNRIEAVFADERFIPLRFTVEDLQKAFDHAGSPLTIAKEKLREHLQGIVLQLATKDYRTTASVNLLVSLPDYIAEGRSLDGCLVMSCARMTAADAANTNPFLWEMFVHGYQGWTAAKQGQLKVPTDLVPPP